ncbi:hypothetical protein BH18THE1_BH18THE1_09150 [soil metagenome]
MRWKSQYLIKVNYHEPKNRVKNESQTSGHHKIAPPFCRDCKSLNNIHHVQYLLYHSLHLDKYDVTYNRIGIITENKLD